MIITGDGTQKGKIRGPPNVPELFRLGLRMSFIVLRTEMFERNVRVLLRGREARVAEKFLYRPQIGPPFKEMSGKGMS